MSIWRMSSAKNAEFVYIRNGGEADGLHHQTPNRGGEMRRHNNLMLLLSLVILSGSLSACRDVGQMMGSRDAELQSGQWWAGPIPDATPVKPDDRTAWIS